VFYAVISLHF